MGSCQRPRQRFSRAGGAAPPRLQSPTRARDPHKPRALSQSLSIRAGRPAGLEYSWPACCAAPGVDRRVESSRPGPDVGSQRLCFCCQISSIPALPPSRAAPIAAWHHARPDGLREVCWASTRSPGPAGRPGQSPSSFMLLAGTLPTPRIRPSVGASPWRRQRLIAGLDRPGPAPVQKRAARGQGHACAALRSARGGGELHPLTPRPPARPPARPQPSTALCGWATPRRWPRSWTRTPTSSPR